jgi:hypothetical protein
MGAVAAHSVRLMSPGTRIVLLCASNSAGVPSHLSRHLDAVECVPAGTEDARSASRWIKTAARRYLDGAMVLLDVDVLVRGDLGPLFGLQADIGAVRNHNAEAPAHQLDDVDLEITRAMGWNTAPAVYCNSGVVAMADTEGARRFAEEWHTAWCVSSRETGRHNDQPAFNHAAACSGASFGLLEDRWNAQVEMRASTAPDALIWHMYAASPHSRPTRFAELARMVSEGHCPVDAEISALVHAPHPWVSRGVMEEASIRLRIARGRAAGLLRRTTAGGGSA